MGAGIGRLTLALILAMGVGAPVARAHQARVGMATESLVLKMTGKRKLVFKGFSDTLTPNAAENPAMVGAGIFVRADGNDGVGRTSFVALDPALWVARTKPGLLRYVYKD